MIYFLRIGADGPIKIGRTANLANRLKEHRSFYSREGFEVLGVMPGQEREERAIHRRFGAWRLADGDEYRGTVEHFSPAPEILEFIEANCVEPENLSEELRPHFRRPPTRVDEKPYPAFVPRQVYALVREASALTGESISGFVARVLEEQAGRIISLVENVEHQPISKR